MYHGLYGITSIINDFTILGSNNKVQSLSWQISIHMWIITFSYAYRIDQIFSCNIDRVPGINVILTSGPEVRDH